MKDKPFSPKNNHLNDYTYMQDSKLLQLIQSLSKEELKTFGNYLEGASHRKTGSVYALYNYFKKLYPDFPEKKVKKEFVYGKIMPKGKEYNDKRIRDLMSILTLNLENFIIAKELEDNEPERELILLNALKKRKQDKLFFQKVKQLERKWEKNPPKGIIKYHYEYLLQKEYYMHPNLSLYEEKPSTLHNVIEKMDHYYFASKLYYEVINLHNQNDLNREGKSKNILIKHINQTITKEEFKHNPHINIFSHFFQAYTTENPLNIESLEKIYINLFPFFNDTEKHDLFIILQGMYYFNYNKGKKEYIFNVFELCKFALEKNIIIENNIIANDMFRNIIGVTCMVQKFEWGYQFIEKYQKYLDDNGKNDIVSLCEATMAFYETKFNTCLEKLLTVKIQDTLYGIQVRILQMQCYYELENYEEAFYNLAHSFATYLHRNSTISVGLQKQNLNFIHVTKKLHKAKKNSTQISSSFVEEIQKNKNIMNKKWLIKKAVELQVLTK